RDAYHAVDETAENPAVERSFAARRRGRLVVIRQLSLLLHLHRPRWRRHHRRRRGRRCRRRNRRRRGPRRKIRGRRRGTWWGRVVLHGHFPFPQSSSFPMTVEGEETDYGHRRSPKTRCEKYRSMRSGKTVT